MPNESSDERWRAAKDEALRILSERAEQPVNVLIYYSELCNLLETIAFSYDSKVFWEFLGEISTAEYLADAGCSRQSSFIKTLSKSPGLAL